MSLSVHFILTMIKAIALAVIATCVATPANAQWYPGMSTSGSSTTSYHGMTETTTIDNGNGFSITDTHDHSTGRGSTTVVTPYNTQTINWN